MKSSYFYLLIALSLVATVASWYMADELGVVLLPFIGVPIFTLSAFTTEFFKIENLILKIMLVLAGVGATIYGFTMTLVGLQATRSGLLGSTIITAQDARLVSLVAVGLYLCGHAGLWLQYFKSKS